MVPIFSQIVYVHGSEPLPGAVQMALDEILLRDTSGVVLRDYLWEELTTSIGYFGKSSDILTILRRPTGGGNVEHGHGRDFTYSIVISASEAKAAKLAPRQSYRAIHQILCTVLRRAGIDATMANENESGDGGQACFSNPVGDDVMLEGKKIAGAGQKRSRGAILHQGSVQPVELSPSFGKCFAQALAGEVIERELDSGLLSAAEQLADEKYRTEEWTRRH